MEPSAPPSIPRRTILRGLGALGLTLTRGGAGAAGAALSLLAGPGAGCSSLPSKRGRAIKVGILHSLSGTMAISERAVCEATQLGIAHINAAGGVLGRAVTAVVADGRSDESTFASQARRLIVEDEVVAVFGCWTSACRKTVRSVFEELDHLLIYPVQYEGLEQSPNIVYTGAAPNQQIIPAVAWSMQHIGKRFFIVGSDYVFPRTASEIIRDYVTALGGSLVGEEYLLLGSEDVADVVSNIVKAKPDVILNTINGDSNMAFFRALRERGIWPQDIPTMSFSIAEPELRSLGTNHLVGDYATWTYFQAVDTDENRRFIRAFRDRYGANQVVGDPMEAAYFGTQLWAQAARQAGRPDVTAVRRCMGRQSYRAPQGIVYVDPDTQHTWKNVRVGRIRDDDQFDIVWDSNEPIRPEPFPLTRRREQWSQFLADLYRSWGNRWARPAN
ncbi:urea ABC transporter substrate-binding protein [Haliangium sp.]|uniref:urea ABC transporter substrate-binding protein n=1 Tax=Haliangium sp. TaxID=2663208 RepID=UPI003D0C8F5A